MPAIYEAHVSLDRDTWLWHRANPGQLSRVAKEAICREIAMDSLPDGLRDDALDDAHQQFFAFYQLQGDYAVIGLELDRHTATEEQMRQDAECLHVPADRLIVTLQELFDLEIEMRLRKGAVLIAARKEM